MLRGWLTLFLGLSGCLWAFAQVEFPLNYYSFAEIAQRMSVEGRKVDCARALQQQLAVVHLKSRSWQQARELLEAGLDVRFRKISESENRWILERDPEVALKERRWRGQLAAYVEKRRDRDARMFWVLMDKNTPVQDAVKQLLEAYAEDSDDLAEPERAQLESQMTKFIEQFRKFPMDQALRDWRAFHRMQRQLSQFLQRDVSSFDENDPFGYYRRFLAENPLSSFGFSKELLDWAQRAAVDERDESLKAFREMFGNAGLSALDDPQLLQMMLLNSLGMFAMGYGQIWARDALLKQMRPPITVLETIEQKVVVRDHTVVLSPDQLAWHLNDVEGKIVPLNSVAPLQAPVQAIASWSGYGFSGEYEFPDALPRSDFFGLSMGNLMDSVNISWEPKRLKRLFGQIDSELVRAYERAYEQHTPLVSHPTVKQPLKASLAQNTPLAEVVYRWAREQQQEVVMEVLGVFQIAYQASGNSLAQRLESSDLPCLLEQRAGVWMVRCWSAFVERVWEYPLAAVRDLIRSDFSYEAWRRFYHAVRPEQARELATAFGFAVWNLREQPDAQPVNVQPQELGEAWLVMAILESLPPDQRARFWDPPRDAPEPVAPLSQLPLEARTRFTQVLTLFRAPLLRIHALQGRERLAPPSTWIERLTLRRAGAYWNLVWLSTDEPKEDEESILLSTPLPGNPSAPEATEPREITPDAARANP
ncbi:MAG: hypothetical protein N2651_01445 [Fimbriimonadales bacterium]|nr:hypothetical protein [Fimbriimonadales bacterium]